MPIQISLKKNLYCPVVVCDWCKQEITDARDGNYEWRVIEEGLSTGEVETGQIFFTHKHCCRPFEYANSNRGRVGWFSGELRDFPILLSHNLEMSLRR